MSCTQSAAAGFHPCRHRIAGAGPESHLRRAVLAHLWRRVARWLARARQRRDLAALDAHLLKDVGVTPGEAAREAAKPFWVE